MHIARWPRGFRARRKEAGREAKSGSASGLETITCSRGPPGAKLGQLVRDYPGVELEITTDDSRGDLASAGYDAGIQFGEYIAQDTVCNW